MALDFPQSPQLDEVFVAGDRAWKWNGYAWDKLAPDRPLYGIASDYEGSPEAGEVLLRHVPAWRVDFEANLAGSRARSVSPATNQADFLIKKEDTVVGTMRFSPGGTVATFLQFPAFSVLAGERISVVAPAIPDASLADISFTLSGSR